MDIFVGNIPFKWKEQNLVKLFEVHGAVISATIVINKMTRQNKGFGFVTMSDDAAAQDAIAVLNGKEFEGRNILVNVSAPNKPESKAIKKKAGHSGESSKTWKPFRGNNWREQ